MFPIPARSPPTLPLERGAAPTAVKASWAMLMGLGHALDIAIKVGYTDPRRLKNPSRAPALAGERKSNWREP